MKAVKSPPVKDYSDRSKAVLILWVIYVISLVFVMLSCASVY